MEPRTRVTGFGKALIGVLIAGLLALFLGSRTLQAVGFTVVAVDVLLLIGGGLPRMRLFGGTQLGPNRVPPDAGPKRPPLDDA
jgi:hypothetical protein